MAIRCVHCNTQLDIYDDYCSACAAPAHVQPAKPLLRKKKAKSKRKPNKRPSCPRDTDPIAS